MRNEVDPDGASRHGFDVVRRISGGGAMMMEKGNVVTYSLYVPAELVQGMSFADSYAFLDDWVLQGLRSLGIDATYQPLNDIASPAGKIGGAAQKRLGPVARLMPTTAATTVRKGTEPLILDGPFAETKEQLLGFYVVDCESRESALEGNLPPQYMHRFASRRNSVSLLSGGT